MNLQPERSAGRPHGGQNSREIRGTGTTLAVHAEAPHDDPAREIGGLALGSVPSAGANNEERSNRPETPTPQAQQTSCDQTDRDERGEPGEAREEHGTLMGANVQGRRQTQTQITAHFETRGRPPATRVGSGRITQGGKKNVKYRTRAHIRVGSLNIRGGGSTATAEKWQQINRVMKDAKISVLAVQETHLSDDRTRELNTQFAGRMKIYNTCEGEVTNARGVAIVVDHNLTKAGPIITRKIIPGRAMTTTIPWKNGREKLTFLAVYAPNERDQNAQFWSRLSRHFDQEEEQAPRPDFMMGDFNLTEDDIDRLPPRLDNEEAVEALQTLKQKLEMVDGWRLENPESIMYSWARPARQPLDESEISSKSRIDRVYIARPKFPTSCEWKYSSHPISSDHDITSAVYYDRDSPYIGKGRWAVPEFLLSDDTFIAEVSQKGSRALEEAGRVAAVNRTTRTNPQAVWKAYKEEIRALAKARSKREMPKCEARMTNLREEKAQLLNNNEIPDEEKLMKTTSIDIELKELEQKRMHNNKMTSGTKFILENETVGKYWIGLNKDKKPRDTIYGLYNPKDREGPMIHRSDQMAEAAKEYHGGLQNEGKCFEANEETREKAILTALGSLKTRVERPDYDELERKLEENEVGEAIRATQTGKASGLDGIPIELYKSLQDTYESGKTQQGAPPRVDITRFMQMVFNDIEDYGVDAECGFAEGWMCPLYKKKDKADIANYRPITILNTDYKAFTKALTIKLAPIALKIIHPDQAGFMTGRRINDQTELVKLIIERCEATDENGYLVFLDQEKAYDKVMHDFLQRTLEHFDFPPRFRSTVGALYEAANTSVVVNGEISEPFRVTRGVRQGDPLSCLLFNLAIESLASMLRGSSLEGMKIKGGMERLITSLFADDTTVFLSEHDRFEDLEKILDEWSTASGAKFNVEKTELLPVGTAEYRHSLKENRRTGGNRGGDTIPDSVHIAEDGEPIRVLGVFVGIGIDDVGVWTPTIEQIIKALERWSRMNPTIEGRRHIVNMEVGGRTQYREDVQGMPEVVRRAINKLISAFIWNGKPPAVDRVTMSEPTELGGRKVLDMEARKDAIDLRRLQRYLSETPPKWKFIADDLIALDIPAYQKVPSRDTAINMFLQTWTPAKQAGRSSLPGSVRRMIVAGKKNGVVFLPPVPNKELKGEMPAWFHIGRGRGSPNENGEAQDCIREKHRGLKVADLVALASKHTHTDQPEISCQKCEHMADEECEDPPKCTKIAEKKLKNLAPKWNMEDTTNQGYTEVPNAGEQEVPFDLGITHMNNMGGGFRIFVPKGTPSATRPIQLGDPGRNGQRERTVDFHIASRKHWEEGKLIIAYGGVATTERHTMERATRLDTKIWESVEAATIAAVADGLRIATGSSKLRIHTTSKTLIDDLTKKMGYLEDRAWTTHKQGKLLESLVSRLRSRDGYTTFVLENPERPTERMRRAIELAAEATDGGDTNLKFDPYAPSQIKGARLEALSQSDIYRLILAERRKKAKPRRHTSKNMEETQEEVKRRLGTRPNPEKIWESYKTKAIHSRKAKALLWKMMHGALPIGEIWTRGRGHEEKAICPLCRTMETADHLFAKCRSNGQDTIWKEARNLLRKADMDLPREMDIPTILGSAITDFKTGERQDTGKNNLYTKIVMESTYLIWILRCKWKIGDKGNPRNIITPPEARNRWRAMINASLATELIATNKKRYGNKALDKHKVLETWKRVVTDDEALERAIDRSWSNGVVVGIG